MIATKPGLISREYGDGDDDAILELMRRALGESDTKKRSLAFWRWKHFDNPFGASFLRVACNERDEIVGLRAFMQWGLWMGERAIRAVRAVDTSTHPDYQRLGIFSNLTKEVVEDSRRNNVDIIFNTPNDASGAGYLKMGWHTLGTVEPLILVLKPHRFLLGMAGSTLGIGKGGPGESHKYFRRPLPAVADLMGYGPALSGLLTEHQEVHQSGRTISTLLSPEYVRWRYVEHPGSTYYAAVDGSGDHLNGAAVVRPGTRFGLTEILVADVWLASQDQRVCRVLMDQITSAVDADYMVAYAPHGSFLEGALKRSGFRSFSFLTRSAKVRKLLTNRQALKVMMTRPLVTDLPVDPLRLQNWSVSMGDLEIF